MGPCAIGEAREFDFFEMVPAEGVEAKLMIRNSLREPAVMVY